MNISARDVTVSSYLMASHLPGRTSGEKSSSEDFAVCAKVLLVLSPPISRFRVNSPRSIALQARTYVLRKVRYVSL